MAGLGLSDRRKRLREQGQLPNDLVLTNQAAAAEGRVAPSPGQQIVEEQLREAQSVTPTKPAEVAKDEIQAMGAFDGFGGLVNAALGAGVIDTGTRSVGLGDIANVSRGGLTSGEPVPTAEQAKSEIQNMGVFSGLGSALGALSGLGEMGSGGELGVAGDVASGIGQAADVIAEPGGAVANALDLGGTGGEGIARAALERDPLGLAGGVADVAQGVPVIGPATEAVETGLGIAQGQLPETLVRQQRRGAEGEPDLPFGVGALEPTQRPEISPTDFEPDLFEKSLNVVSNIFRIRGGQPWLSSDDIAMMRAMDYGQLQILNQRIENANRAEFLEASKDVTQSIQWAKARMSLSDSPEVSGDILYSEVENIRQKYGDEAAEYAMQEANRNPHLAGLDRLEAISVTPGAKDALRLNDREAFFKAMKSEEGVQARETAELQKALNSGLRERGQFVMEKFDDAFLKYPELEKSIVGDDGQIDLQEVARLQADPRVGIPTNKQVRPGELLALGRNEAIARSEFGFIASERGLTELQANMDSDRKVRETIAIDRAKSKADAEEARIPSLSDTSSLRGQYNTEAKPFNERKRAFATLNAALSTRKQAIANGQVSPASDLAIVFGFMRSLDPTSVVRESEQRLAIDARGIPQAMKQRLEAWLNGEVLTDEQVADMEQVVANQFNASLEQFNELNQKYYSIASRGGFDPGQILGEDPEEDFTEPKPGDVRVAARLMGIDPDLDTSEYTDEEKERILAALERMGMRFGGK